MQSQHMYEENKAPHYTEGYSAEARSDPASPFDERPEQAHQNQFGDNFGQKVYASNSQVQNVVTAKQRMIVAIVSVSLLVPLTAIILTSNVSDDTAGNIMVIISRMIILILVCLTIMIINLALGWRRS